MPEIGTLPAWPLLDSKEQHFIDGCVQGHFHVLLFNVLHHAEVDFDTAPVLRQTRAERLYPGLPESASPYRRLAPHQWLQLGGDTAQPVASRNVQAEIPVCLETALASTGCQVEHIARELDPQTLQIELIDGADALAKADTCNRLGREGGLSELYLRPLFKLV
ncbi:hypothetical protein [Pseudomonas sp. IT-P253]|jgi:hypothetical protein|uniref:hypothetical protein n=1 Tax=Pseudomonas sp. IT-P253 TaxID=3026455 RepID=UPI0039E0E524